MSNSIALYVGYFSIKSRHLQKKPNKQTDKNKQTSKQTNKQTINQTNKTKQNKTKNVPAFCHKKAKEINRLQAKSPETGYTSPPKSIQVCIHINMHSDV